MLFKLKFQRVFFSGGVFFSQTPCGMRPARVPARGDSDQVVPGNALVVDKTMPFQQLSHFGDRFPRLFYLKQGLDAELGAEHMVHLLKYASVDTYSQAAETRSMLGRSSAPQRPSDEPLS